VAATRFRIPARQRAQVPPLLWMLSEQRTFWTVFGVGLAALSLYGPITRHVDHNVWRCLLGPFLCPLIPAAYFWLRPLNPYRTGGARFSGMLDLHMRDQEAGRLVGIFESNVAKRSLFRSTILVSIILFVVMLVATLLCIPHLNWLFPSPWLGQGLLGGCIGSSIAIMTLHVDWGLRAWAATLQGN
jgi:hypothetical protein